MVVGPVRGAADALQTLALGEVRLQEGPGVLEVRATAQSPSGAKGPTAGTVRADEPQTGNPPAGAAVQPGGAATQPGATGSPAQPPAASPVPTPAAPGPGTLPPPTSQQPPPPTRP